MNKSIINILIVALVLLVIFGILYGWFRKRTKLSEEEEKILRQIQESQKPSLSSLPTEYQNPKDLFSKLWKDHVSHTREFILATFRNQPDVKNKEEILLQNQKDMGTVINTYYPNSGDLITKLLTEHIVIAKNIVEDLKYRRFDRLSPDINSWYSNADEFAKVVQSINSDWDIYSPFHEHLRITEREALYEWVGARQTSANIYTDKIVPNAQKIANIFSSGITKNFNA